MQENKECEHRMDTPRPNINRKNCTVIKSANILFRILTIAMLYFSLLILSHLLEIQFLDEMVLAWS